MDQFLDCKLLEACENNDFLKVSELIKLGANVNIQRYPSETPLSFAVKSGNYNIAQILLESGADSNHWDDLNGRSILSNSIRFENIEIIELLLRFNANINSIETNELAPLHTAICNNCLEIVKLLIRYKCDINLKSSSLNTALHIAVIVNNIEIAKILLENGIDQTCLNIAGYSAEQIAINKHYKEISLFIGSWNSVNQNNMLIDYCNSQEIPEKEDYSLRQRFTGL